MKGMIATLITVGCLNAYAHPMNVLVFSKTAGFRHDSIPAGISCLKALADKNNWRMTATENAAVFSDTELAEYDVCIFVMTTGNVLDEKEQDAFVRFIRSGKGFVGIHSATITENDSPWFVGLVGAKFIGHPPSQRGRLIVEDRDHLSIPATMPREWTREDEWYSFDRNPREKARVLVSIDESSYDVDDNQWFPGIKQRMGDHPLVWCHEYDGGRAFQTALGHTEESYADPIFVAHLEGAIRWAAKENQEKVR